MTEPGSFGLPALGVAAANRDHGEHRTHLLVLRQRRVQPEHRKDQDQGDDRETLIDHHVVDSFDLRHGARLLSCCHFIHRSTIQLPKF